MALVGASAEKAAVELRAATQVLIGRDPQQPQWLEDWFRLLASDSWQVRALAVALGSRLPVANRPYAQLLQALDSDNTGLRNSVISLFLAWGSSVTQVVVQHYHGASARVRKFLLDGLRGAEPELIVPFLHSIWSESDLNLRVSILETVSTVKGSVSRDFVQRYRADLTDSSLRLAALECVRLHVTSWSEIEILSLAKILSADESTHRSLIGLAQACQPVMAVTLLQDLLPVLRSVRRVRDVLDGLAQQAVRSSEALHAIGQISEAVWAQMESLGVPLPPILQFARQDILSPELLTWIPPDVDAVVCAILLARADRVQIMALMSDTPHARVAALACTALYRQDPSVALQLAQTRILRVAEDCEPMLDAVAALHPLSLVLWTEQAIHQRMAIPRQVGHTALVIPQSDRVLAQAALIRAAAMAHDGHELATVLQLSFAVHFVQPPAFVLLALRSPEDAIRALALNLVASMTDFDVQPSLRTALLDESDLVFRAALGILVQLPQNFSRPIVEELWQRTQYWQQWAVFRALERMTDDPCELLERGFDSQYPPIVLDTVLLAQRCVPEASADAIAVCLHHPDPAIVARSVDWHRVHGRTLPAGVLHVRLLDPSTMVRLAVWSYLEAQGTMSLETELLQAALERESDPHLFMRISHMAGRQQP